VRRIEKPVICWAVFDTLANIAAMPARERTTEKKRIRPFDPDTCVSTCWRDARFNQGISSPS
jgi:hypothetical protein